jgi:folate-binding protein YgfZ
MSNSIPNHVEAGSTGSTADGLVAEGKPEARAAKTPGDAQITPLAEALRHANSLSVQEYRGAESIGNFSNPAEELAALRYTVGIYDLGWRRLIRCTGEDRGRWLNGMVTNFVSDLDENAGCYSFVLNAQGRIQGDMDIYRCADSFWLETDAAQLDALTAFLDRYIIMDDVTLEPQPQWTVLGIAGPGAAAAIAEAGLPVPSSTLHMLHGGWQGHAVDVIAGHSPLVPRYEIWIERESVLALWNALTAAGAAKCGVSAIESLRILEGTPAYSVDITSKDLPQETNQMRALHFNKGCYLGQEIVERVHSRGNVHRTFTGFVLADGRPTPGTPMLAEGKPVGEITSVARVTLSENGDRVLALGNIRREALQRKLDLKAGETSAIPSLLPFTLSSDTGQPIQSLR